ncbi:uncharacterized protein K02A2.6-like [Diorhabda carinulata]|uniref:uncharacterized protein K02A2.6-like n=1 Tax=Diorhabda carinulata TaxID=1163345 RepID=UPI0025A10671|nr:uncharacterized protein K02A2.6-like [Diorhabda carinulata]
MCLRLMKYQLEVSYLPGKQMFIADMLSRAFLKGPVKNDTENNFIVHNIDKKIPMSANKISEIVGETNNDTTLALVKKFIVQGWPKNNKSLSPELKNLFQIRSELSIENDLILFGDRVVITKNLRILMLSKLHEGHLGINKCRARARESIFWPNISNDINNFILNCEVCLKFRNNNPKLPLLQHNIPERPWQEIAMDICEFQGNFFLVVIDYFSRWIELKDIKNKDSVEVVKALKNIFSVHGFPETIISDNNPFNSFYFKNFLNEINISLKTSIQEAMV